MYKSLLLVISCLTITFPLHAQLNLQTSFQQNTVPDGVGCSYSGPKILINEIMIKPNSGNGCIYGTNASQRGEWVELYNPDLCKVVDISCYYLGNYAPEGTEYYGGGFALPQGTIVPPGGFVVVRGMNAPAVPSALLVQNGGNTVDLVVGTSSSTCFGTGGSRFWLGDASGWIAVYDENGVPQDAIVWNSPADQTLNGSPCNPVGSCSYSGNLVSYNEISSDRKTIIFSGNLLNGITNRRSPDGGPWVLNTQANATYGTCNGVCITPPVITCTGQASVGVSGGMAPYTYIWDDGRAQATPTATGLCAGSYCVTVTDANEQTADTCVTVTDFIPTGSITGRLVYGNTASTPMDGVKLYLKPLGGSAIDSVNTDQNGYYIFHQVPGSQYVVTPLSDKPWGGVNSIDALLIMKHFTGITPLTGIYLKGADLNASLSINSVDALLDMKRFVGLMNSFVVGDWVFENDIVTVSDTACSQHNFVGICYGDMNGSYTPLPCFPYPSQAYAGYDSLNIPGTTLFLQANMPVTGNGKWKIISGDGGSFANPTSANTSFTGLPGTTYNLSWNITTLCFTSSDTVTVSFANSFGQPCPGIPSFIYGGQTYNTVLIGNQCWMKENLNIGTMVTSVNTGSSHSECSNNGIIEKYCYNNDPANCDIYGGLYDWNEMMQYTMIPGTQGICPTGWHIPDHIDWGVLEGFLNDNPGAGGKMKETGFAHWNQPNTGATNESGFTGLGAGFRYKEGNFSGLLSSGMFWTSSDIFSLNTSYGVYRFLSYNNSNLGDDDTYLSDAYSVRCVKECVVPPSSPYNFYHTPSPTQIVWRWSSVNGATGYKWSTTNDYETAIDMGSDSSYTETGLNCDTEYTRYVWAYNTCGNSTAISLIENTLQGPYGGVWIHATANSVCHGEAVTFYADPIGGSSPYMFQWIVNWETVSFEPTFTYTPVNGDTIACLLYAGFICNPGEPVGSNLIVMTVNPVPQVFVSISASSNPLCELSPVTLTATPINGGLSPSYFWLYNGIDIDIHSPSFELPFFPANGSTISCVLISNAFCADGNQASSNLITFSVSPVPPSPTPGIHESTQTSITWKWNPSIGALGYRWNTDNNFFTAIDLGDSLSYTETGLDCDSICTRYIWAYDTCDYFIPTTLTQSTSECPFSCGMNFTDSRDNKVYSSVKIGTQCWMKENLNIGTSINNSENQTNNNTIEKYCLNNEDANCTIYGGLYQWDELMNYSDLNNSNPFGPQGICPDGWHIPSDMEWCQMETYLDSTVNCIEYGLRGTDIGGKMKEIGTSHWASPNTGASNSSGFTALGSYGPGSMAIFWSSTKSDLTSNPISRYLYFNSQKVFRAYDNGKMYSFASRCIKNDCLYLPDQSNAGPDQTIVGGSVTLQGNIPEIGIGYWSIVSGSGGNIEQINNPNSVFIGTGGITYTLVWNICTFCENSIDTVQITLITPGDPCPGIPFFYYGGQTYNTVQIGTQCWMKENLNVGIMINGSQNQENNSVLEKYCSNNDLDNCAIYGGLYQWNEMMQYTNVPGSQGICPTNWHIPTNAEWCTLTTYLGDTSNCNPYSYATIPGGKLKETGTTHWKSPNYGATNSSGFTAIPGGWFSPGVYQEFLYNASFWTSSESSTGDGAWYRWLNYSYERISSNIFPKSIGFSLRCVKDCSTPPSSPSTGYNYPSSTQIIWHWNPVTGATGYKWSTTNDFETAIDLGSDSSYTEAGLNCDTEYTRYVWAYNTCGNSMSIALTESTLQIPYVDVWIGMNANYICQGDEVTFYACANTQDPYPGFQWLVNWETLGFGPVFTYSPANGDTVACLYVSDFLCGTYYSFISNFILMTVYPPLPVSVTVSPSENPVCPMTPVIFTATPVNGGTSPIYQWKMNGVDVGNNSPIFSYDPMSEVNVSCELTSGEGCVSGNPAMSDPVNLVVTTIPTLPVEGTHIPTQSQITWNWDAAFGAAGYRLGITDDFFTAADLGDTTSKTETGLSCGTTYTRYLFAYDTCFDFRILPLIQSTSDCNNACPLFPTISCDGQTYHTVLIGSQCWMKENLNIGNMISNSSDQTNNNIIEKYCYDGIESNCDIYGGLYQWNEMMQYTLIAGTRGICPLDWHIPDDNDWQALAEFLGGWNIAGGKMKETGLSHWNSPNTGATNESGFTALGAAYRFYDGNTYDLGNFAYFWSSSQYDANHVRDHGIQHNDATMGQGYSNKAFGFSVRCMMDTCYQQPTQSDAGSDQSVTGSGTILEGNYPQFGSG
ncbi:MAG: lamin tail domain-containing protein, partial [Bacteroidetes bacterium]|nr:lamin tail domain-containing protein [Bacteroidota bacterium]